MTVSAKIGVGRGGAWRTRPARCEIASSEGVFLAISANIWGFSISFLFFGFFWGTPRDRSKTYYFFIFGKSGISEIPGKRLFWSNRSLFGFGYRASGCVAKNVWRARHTCSVFGSVWVRYACCFNIVPFPGWVVLHCPRGGQNGASVACAPRPLSFSASKRLFEIFGLFPTWIFLMPPATCFGKNFQNRNFYTHTFAPPSYK
jgi:hypothetical protein